MDWASLFFSLKGRINRKQFWIGLVVLALAGLVVHFGLSLALGLGIEAGDGVGAAMRDAWASLVAFGVLGYPAFALMVKRRHDCGRSGFDVTAYFIAYVVTLIIPAFGLGFDVVTSGGASHVQPGLVLGTISTAAGLFGVYILAVCGFLKGYEGGNAYGRDPIPDGI